MREADFGSTYFTSGTSFTADNWYRITVEFDYTGNGDNVVTMSVRNLTDRDDVSITMSSWTLTNTLVRDRDRGAHH